MTALAAPATTAAWKTFVNYYVEAELHQTQAV